MEKFFNFNNEQDLTPIDVDSETGAVTFEYQGQSETFESVTEFAEFYATARNVKHDNLKNWTLIEDGNTYSFILRAGTAGLDETELGNMVRVLRATGMSPEDIGRAIAGAQSAAPQSSVIEPEEDTDETFVDRAIESIEARKEDGYLFLAYGVQDLDALKQAILADEDVFDDLRYRSNMDEVYDYDEDGEEIYREESFDREDNLYNNLHDKIHDEKTRLREKYQGINPFIALTIEQGTASEEDLDAARAAYNKARKVARVAGRRVQVTVVTNSTDGDVIVTHTFDNQVGEDMEQGDLYVNEHRFVLHKPVTLVVPEDESQNTVEDNEQQ